MIEVTLAKTEKCALKRSPGENKAMKNCKIRSATAATIYIDEENRNSEHNFFAITFKVWVFQFKYIYIF